MSEHDALQDRFKGLKETQPGPTEAQIVSVLRRGKRRRVASLAGAGLGMVAIVAIAWSVLSSFSDTPDIPPARNEKRVTAGVDVRSGDVIFSGSAGECWEGVSAAGDLPEDGCRFSLGLTNTSDREIVLRSEDIYLEVDGTRYEVVNNEYSDYYEAYYGPNFFFEVSLGAREGGGPILFEGLSRDLTFPLELHVRAPGGEPVIIEIPECAIHTEPGTSITLPCD